MIKAYIQAVESRLPYVNQSILPSLNKHGIANAEVFCDYEMISPLWNAKRIWKAAAQEQATALILQDDVILHNQFGEHALEITKHIESGKMQGASLFVPPRKIYAEYKEQGFNYIENYDFLWMPAVMFSTRLCAELIKFAETSEHVKHDDSLVKDYLRHTKTPIYNCLPSIVQHNLNLKSTLGTAKKIGKILRHSYVWDKEITAGHFSNINSVIHK